MDDEDDDNKCRICEAPAVNGFSLGCGDKACTDEIAELDRAYHERHDPSNPYSDLQLKRRLPRWKLPNEPA